MKASTLVLTAAVEVIGLGLLVWAVINNNMPLMVIGVALTFLGTSLMTTLILAKARLARPGTTYVRSFGDHPTTEQTATSGTAYSAVVRHIQNTGSERGVGRFGTEIAIDINLDGTTVAGVVRDYLTPAQITMLPAGITVNVRPSAKHPGEWDIVSSTSPTRQDD